MLPVCDQFVYEFSDSGGLQHNLLSVTANAASGHKLVAADLVAATCRWVTGSDLQDRSNT